MAATQTVRREPRVMLTGIVVGGIALLAVAILVPLMLTGPSSAQRAASRTGAADASFVAYLIEHDRAYPANASMAMISEYEKLGRLDCRALAGGATPTWILAHSASNANAVAVLKGAVRFYCPQYRAEVP